MGKILIPKETPDWKQILSDTEGARDTAVSAKNTAVAARDDAEEAATDIGALGGIDGTVQTTSDLPSSTGSGDYYYVADQAAYYKDTGSGSVQGGWTQSGPDLASLDKAQVFTKQQQFDSGINTRGDVVDGQGNMVYDYNEQEIASAANPYKLSKNTSRPIFPDWTGGKTVEVDAGGGKEYTSIQAAWDNEAPLIFDSTDARLTIQVADGTYNEHLQLGPLHGGNIQSGDANRWVQIIGDPTTPTNVVVNSVHMMACHGLRNPRLIGLTTRELVPGVNENGMYVAQNASNVDLVKCAVRPTNPPLQNAVVAYDSNVGAELDVGTGNVTRVGVIKDNGVLNLAPDSTGSVNSELFDIRSGNATISANQGITAGKEEAIFNNNPGIVHDGNTGETILDKLRLYNAISAYDIGGPPATISANTTEELQWPGIQTDELGLPSSNSDKDKEIQLQGLYRIEFQFLIDPQATAHFQGRIRVNGTEKSRVARSLATLKKHTYYTVFTGRLQPGDLISTAIVNPDSNSVDIRPANFGTFLRINKMG